MDIIKVSNEEATKIIQTGNPTGLFFTIEQGRIVGINNTHNDLLVEDFNRFTECTEWLQGKKSV
ncbi:hypothetical protein [Bacillus massiliigorillae]|uniref:hypothetical protein n=1 Tax=Bacillus massiliigorillae TaxID=1243664 RepID=UPI00039CE5F5|nr:hypothetical protein [Bacillus massiliigorillae]